MKIVAAEKEAISAALECWDCPQRTDLFNISYYFLVITPSQLRETFNDHVSHAHGIHRLSWVKPIPQHREDHIRQFRIPGPTHIDAMGL
jgi:hypothetical protein